MARGEGGGSPKGSKDAYGKKSGNADIAKLGAATRFGAKNGPDPKAAQLAWVAARRKNATIRKHCATLMGSEICCADVTTLKLEDFASAFGLSSVNEMTFGHLAAVQFFKQAMGNGKVMMAFVDNVDGKQVQRRENKQVDSWSSMIMGSLDESGDSDE